MSERRTTLRNRFFCLLISLWFATLQSSGQSTGDYGQAMAEFRAGNYSSAASLFAKAEDSSPGTTDALLYAGKSFVHLQNYVQAENALRLYLVQHQESDDALYLLGFVLHREGKPRESLETYTKAAARKPPLGDDLKIVGLNYVLLNDHTDAIKWLEKAVEIDSRNKEAWYYLGRAYYTESRFAHARRAFLTVLNIDPRDAKAENNLGLIFESEGKPEDAIDAYRTAIAWQEESLHPSEQPYINLGSILVEQDRIDEAIPVLKKALDLAPNDAVCHLKLGTAYFRRGQLKEAQQALERATQLDPENAAAHYQLGRLYKKIHAGDRAKAEFDRTAELQSRAAGATLQQPKP